jgi:Ca-activated chloride channel family protein
MMAFANQKYFIYIALVAAIVMALYAGYIVWRGVIVSRLLANPSVRARLVMRDRFLSALKAGLVFFCAALFAFTALRPQWGEETREATSEGVDLLVALDVSNSMLARDVSPSRLERSRDAVRLLSESLRGDHAGLVLFAGEAFIQCPLTSDMGAFNMFLNSAGPGAVRIPGTNMGAAFEMAYRVFNKRRMTSRNLVIISDGEDHEGKVDAAAEKFRDLGVTVFAVAVGREGGELIPLSGDDTSGDIYQKDTSGSVVRTKKNPGLLRRVAEATGGEYIDITDSFSGIYRIVDRMGREARNPYGTRIVKEKKERYQVFALILAVLLLIELLLPERRLANTRKEK